MHISPTAVLFGIAWAWAWAPFLGMQNRIVFYRRSLSNLETKDYTRPPSLWDIWKRFGVLRVLYRPAVGWYGIRALVRTSPTKILWHKSAWIVFFARPSFGCVFVNKAPIYCNAGLGIFKWFNPLLMQSIKKRTASQLPFSSESLP